MAYSNYVAQAWVDGSASTPISAARLGVEETGIYNAHFMPTVRVTATADTTISNATWTAIPFGSEDWDTAGGAADTQHDNSTNNSRLIAKYAGKYLVTGCVHWAANATGQRQAAIVKNAGTPPTPGAGDYIQEAPAINVTGSPRITVTGIYDMSVNDYVVLAVYQSSTGNLAVLGTTAAERPLFGMVRVA